MNMIPRIRAKGPLAALLTCSGRVALALAGRPG